MNDLTRWNDPFHGLSRLHSHLDDIFKDFMEDSRVLSMPNAPRIDIYSEDDERLVTEVQIPGFDKDEVNVNVHDGILEISGEKQERKEDKDKKRNYMVRESSVSFYRRVALPKYADTDKIEADFDNGVLKVVIPFKDLPKPKKVQIGSGKTGKK